MSGREGFSPQGIEAVRKYLQFGREELIFETSLYISNMMAIGDIEDTDAISEGEIVFGLHIKGFDIHVGSEFLRSIMPMMPGTAALLSLLNQLDNSFGFDELIKYVFRDGYIINVPVDESFTTNVGDYTLAKNRTLNDLGW